MREERVAARKSEESKPGEETFKKSTRHSESERPGPLCRPSKFILNDG